MSDEAATVDGGGVNSEEFGPIYEVEERFLLVPPPKERMLAIGFLVTFAVLAVTWYFVTLEDRTFESARLQNTKASFELYLADYPNGVYVDKARSGIDDLAWAEYRKTLDYEGYLKEYPAGNHAGSARQAIDDLLYRDKKKEGTIPAFAAYLAKYPEGRHAKGAKNEIRRIATAQFNNCMNTCIQAKGEPGPRDNFVGDCCTVCAGLWVDPEAKPPPAEGSQAAEALKVMGPDGQPLGARCIQAVTAEGTLVSPPATAAGVTPKGTLPPRHLVYRPAHMPCQIKKIMEPTDKLQVLWHMAYDQRGLPSHAHRGTAGILPTGAKLPKSMSAAPRVPDAWSARYTHDDRGRLTRYTEKGEAGWEQPGKDLSFSYMMGVVGFTDGGKRGRITLDPKGRHVSVEGHALTARAKTRHEFGPDNPFQGRITYLAGERMVGQTKAYLTLEGKPEQPMSTTTYGPDGRVTSIKSEGLGGWEFVYDCMGDR